MTVDELLALPSRVAAIEQQLRDLGTLPTRQPVTDTPVVALWTPTLTTAERELLPMIAAGWSSKQIAGARGNSEKTIRSHMYGIMTKLQLTSRTEVALWALATGIVDMRQAVRLMVTVQPHLDASAEGGE